MKNTILAILIFASFSLANAQSIKKNVIEANVGITSYLDYPAISVVSDNTPSYSTLSYGVTYGRCIEGLMLGVQWHYSTQSTAHVELNESVLHNTFSLFTRYCENLGEHIELYGGVHFGLSLTINGITHLDNNYGFSRTGIFCKFSLGVNYNLSHKTYLGLQASMNAPCANLQKEINLPTPLTVNNKRILNGYSVTFNYGIRF